MKKILFLFLLSLSGPCIIAQGRISVSVMPDDKITMHGFCYWQNMEVRSKDTSFACKLHHASPDVIKNLQPGTYTFTAQSVFNGHLSKKVSISKKGSSVKLKGLATYYKRSDASTSLSEKIKMNDTLFVVYSSSSNENEKEKIGIAKTASGYTAIQYKGLGKDIFQTMQVKETAFAAVKKFEAEGKKSNSPKAETAPIAEIYTIALHKEIVSFIVPGQWHGIDQLKAALFIVEK